MKKLVFIIVIVLCMTACSNSNLGGEVVPDKKADIGEVSKMNIVIDNKKFDINLDNNETVSELIDHLPLELTMNELNENEKYAYLDFSLTTDEVNPKKIKSGDVMLFGDNCLVLFYRNFNTSYSYTRIGHIDNFDISDVSSDSINVKLEME